MTNRIKNELKLSFSSASRPNFLMSLNLTRLLPFPMGQFSKKTKAQVIQVFLMNGTFWLFKLV